MILQGKIMLCLLLKHPDVILSEAKDLLNQAHRHPKEILRFAPKEVRHVEPCETSPEHQEIPHFVQDDVLLFRCLPLRG